MKKFLPFLLLFFSYSTLAQVGINTIGTVPAPSAMLNVSSLTKGVLIPKMTSFQKFAIINPVEGLMVYDLDVKQFSYCLTPSFGGTVLINCNWVNFGNTSSNWYANGNDIVNTNGGNVGIGNYTPNAKLDVAGNVKIADGTQGAGKVLTSDATGLASWQSASTSPSAVGIGFDGLLFQYFIASNTPSYLRWGNKLYEFNGSNYNTTTGEYTISKKGFYMIHVAIRTTRVKDNISI